MPTYFSSVVLLFAAGLLGVVARSKRAEGAAYARHWTGLALIFAFLSLDEMASIHERIGILMERVVGSYDGFFWAVPFGVLVLLFAASYLRFLLHLPRRQQVTFATGGLLYVGGAIGMELVGGSVWMTQGSGPLYLTLMTLEETLEMAGAIVFVYGLLAYLASERTALTVHFGNARDDQPEPVPTVPDAP